MARSSCRRGWIINHAVLRSGTWSLRSKPHHFPQEIPYTDTLPAMPLSATLLRSGTRPLLSSRVRLSL